MNPKCSKCNDLEIYEFREICLKYNREIYSNEIQDFCRGEI